MKLSIRSKLFLVILPILIIFEGIVIGVYVQDRQESFLRSNEEQFEMLAQSLLYTFQQSANVQEYTQDTHKTRPVYQLIKEIGPAHDRTFGVAVRLNGKVIAEGEGKTKKEAEQKAAKEAYYCLSRDRHEF